MNITESLARIILLVTFLTVGMLGIFALPTMDNSASWFTDFLITKTIGVSCIWAFSRLFTRWRKEDRWIRAYDRWNKTTLLKHHL